MSDSPDLERIAAARAVAEERLRAANAVRAEAEDELRAYRDLLRTELRWAEDRLRETAIREPAASRRLVTGSTDTLLGQFAALPHDPEGWTWRDARKWMQRPEQKWRSGARNRDKAVAQAISRRVRSGHLRVVYHGRPLRRYVRADGLPWDRNA
jgi:hypothetical protein